MERLKTKFKNLGLHRAFVFIIATSLLSAFLLTWLTISICVDIRESIAPTGVYITYDESGNRIITPAPIPTAEEQQLANIVESIQYILTILYFSIAMILSSMVFYRCKLKKPIHKLQASAERIMNQDLDFTISPDGMDEMGQLCIAFEKMRVQLKRNNQELWQQAEERKRLNAAFSHDLRNPITVLKGTVKLMRQGIQDEQTIDRLESYTLRLEQYVEAMSSVQRLEQLSVHPKAIVLSVLQSELQETARLLAGTKKYSLSVPSAGEVVLDHGIFLTVAENLIGNAARFAKSELSIEAVLENGHLLLKISDDGPGYPPALIENGPKPFETASSNSSHFGMGLYNSQLLCEKHGGNLILENQTPVGATATAVFQLSFKP